ncbi:MAG: universal stress protein [Arcobacter sp.]|nr:MAG: universal stress protein [Arcobacter sp.]
MEYKRIFFPLGGGGELRGRIHGALLIAKYFKAHIEIFKAQVKPSQMMKFDNNLPEPVLKELNAMTKDRFEEELHIHETIFNEEIKKIGDITASKPQDGQATAETITGEGFRSKLIEQESKYCDLVIVSSPHDGRITATFEATITKSGKPALMFPREMTEFNTDNILIGWNDSPEISKTVSRAMPLLRKAKRVHIISSKEYIKDLSQMTRLQDYLLSHNIKTTYEIVKTTKTPGQALLKYAQEENFDLIVAGAFGTNKGLRELMFGGTTKYMLSHSTLPIFMAH